MKKGPRYYSQNDYKQTKQVQPKKQKRSSSSSSSSPEDFGNENAIFPMAKTGQNNKIQKQLSPYDQKYKHVSVSHGLNLKGRCSNQNCKGRNGIWVMLRYGNFNIGQERYKQICPGCGKKVKGDTFRNIGFIKAKVIITGVRIQGGEEVEVNDQYEETKGKLATFLDQDQHIGEWGFMNVQCTKI